MNKWISRYNVVFPYFQQVNPTSLRCSLDNANWGYGNLASMCCQKKISTFLLVVIILLHCKRHMWTIQLWDGASGKTQSSGLPTSLHQEGHLAVKHSDSIKSCKCQMSYNGAISSRDAVVPGREKVRCGPIQNVIQRPHQVCKTLTYVSPHGK